MMFVVRAYDRDLAEYDVASHAVMHAMNAAETVVNMDDALNELSVFGKFRLESPTGYVVEVFPR